MVATISSPGAAPVAAMAQCSSDPAPNMAMPAMAGLARRLVQRLDVRHEPTAASAAAASVAAAGPCMSSSRKMKISPAANECFWRGMRTGKHPASIATAMPLAICSTPSGVSRATLNIETTSTAAPASTAHHQ